MRLGLNLGYWSGAPGSVAHLALVEEAERLGFSVAWAAEAYGSDAATVLAFLAARTSRIDVGSAVMQIPGRTPAMTAMTAATLDALSGGRFRLGLGVSGPQVSEGWHGVRFAKPLARTREYVDVVRLALSRRPVSYAGEQFALPLPDGPGKTLRLTVHPVRERIPLYLAAVGPKNLELAGEIADGWLAIFPSTEFLPEQLGSILDGRSRAGRLDSPAAGPPAAGPPAAEPFDVVATAPVLPTPDDRPETLAAAADLVRGYAALYLGGMGSREQNFYNRLAVRMGYAEEAATVQELFLSGKHRQAAAAVPAQFIDRTSLIGTVDRIADRMREFAAAGVTTLSVATGSLGGESRDGDVAVLRAASQALAASGVGS